MKKKVIITICTVFVTCMALSVAGLTTLQDRSCSRLMVLMDQKQVQAMTGTMSFCEKNGGEEADCVKVALDMQRRIADEQEKSLSVSGCKKVQYFESDIKYEQ